MPFGPLAAIGSASSVMSPAVVMRPTRFPVRSVNHMLPLGPLAMPVGAPSALGA